MHYRGKAQSYVTDKYSNLIPFLKDKTKEHVTSSLGSEFHSLTESTKKKKNKELKYVSVLAKGWTKNLE